MTNLEIVRHALPLRVARCELTDYSLHLGGSEWHLNATCPYEVSTAELWNYNDDSAPHELEHIADQLIGTTIEAIESNADLDDPTFFLDDGTQISLTADPNDTCGPWTMRVPGISLIGDSPAEIEHFRITARTVEPGELTDLGEVRGVQSFPPGWALTTDAWTVLVACPWQVSRPEGDGIDHYGAIPVTIGMQLKRVRYSARDCVLDFGDATQVVVNSDAGRAPWFISNRHTGTRIVGQSSKSSASEYDSSDSDEARRQR